MLRNKLFDIDPSILFNIHYYRRNQLSNKSRKPTSYYNTIYWNLQREFLGNTNPVTILEFN